MKTIYQIALFLLLITASSTSDEVEPIKWTVKITPTDGSDKLKVKVGQFSKAKITLSTNTTIKKIPSKKFKIKLPNEFEAFVSEPTEYELNPYESMEYDFYIGIPCDKRDKAKEKNFNLTFQTENKNIEILQLPVEVDQSKESLDFTLMLDEVKLNSYGMLKLTQNILTIEDIELKFDKVDTNAKNAFFEDFKIRKFEKDKKELESTKEYFGKYGYKDENKPSIVTQTFILKDFKNECYEIKNKNFSFNVSNTQPEKINDTLKYQILDTLKDEQNSNESNVIEVNVTIPVAPVLVDCALAHSCDIFNNYNNIIEHQSQGSVLYKEFFLSSPQEISVKFTDIEKNKKYGLECVVQNNKIDKTDKVGFGIGYFKKADIIKALIPSNAKFFPTQCAKWTFDSSKFDGFVNKVEDYCEEYISDGNPAKENGCVSCSVEAKENNVIVCASGEPVCKSNYHESPEEAKEIFKQFAESLNDTDKIKNEFNITDFNPAVKNLTIEVEESEPDKSKITATANEDKTIFTVSNANDKDIYCVYNKDLEKPNINKFMTRDNIKNTSIVVLGNDKTEIQMDKDKIKEEKIYSLVLDCNYLPKAENHFYTTGIFTVLSFYNAKHSKKDAEKKEKYDCSKRKDSPQCLKKKVKDFVHIFKSKMPDFLDKILLEIDDFIYMSKEDQLYFLDKAKEEFDKIAKNGKGKKIELFKKGIEVARILTQIDCLKFNDYDQCREIKIKFIDLIISKIKDYIQLDSTKKFIEKIKDLELYEEEKTKFQESLKYLLIIINDLSANVDALSEDSNEYILNIATQIKENFDEIIKQIEEEIAIQKNEEAIISLIKDDILNLLTEAIGNYIDTIHYEELDNKLKDLKKVTKNSKLLVSEKARKLKKNIETTIELLSQLGDGTYEINNIKVKIKMKFNNITEESNDYETEKYEDGSIKVEIPFNKLHLKYETSYCYVLKYQSYPLLTAKENVMSSNFIGLKCFDKEKKEIKIQKLNESLPMIYYKNDENHFTKCLYYNEDEKEMKNDGVTGEITKNDGENYTVCKVEHFTDFTVGNFVLEKGLEWWAVLLIIIFIIIVLSVLGFLLYHFYFKKETSSSTPKVQDLTEMFQEA